MSMKTNKIMDEIRSSISPEMKMQMEMSVAIANRIYEILEARGMTQKDLAKRLGKTETEVSRWLSGTHNLTLATICKISAALETEVVKEVSKLNSVVISTGGGVVLSEENMNALRQNGLIVYINRS